MGQLAADAIAERLDRMPLGRLHIALMTVMFAALTLGSIDVLSFAIPAYSAEWGLSATAAALNPTTALAAGFAGAIFWGTIADRVGRKRVLILTLGIFLATTAINGFAWSFPQLVLTCVVMGFGVGGSLPLAFTLLAEYTPARHRGRVMVLVGMTAFAGGYLLASTGALLLMDRFGWRSLFLLGVAPAALLPLVAWLVPESPRYLLARGRLAEALRIVERLERSGPRGGSVPSARPLVRAEPHGTPAAPRASGYRRTTLALWIYAFAFGFFASGFLTWLPSLLREAGLAGTSVHVSTTTVAALAIPAGGLAAFLYASWGAKRTLALYPALAGSAMLLLAVVLGRGEWGAIGLLAPVGLVFVFGITVAGLLGPYAAEIYPTAIRSAGAGWASGMSRAGALAAIPLGGALLATGAPLFVHQIVFGLPLLVGALSMAALGVEPRARRLEELARV